MFQSKKIKHLEKEIEFLNDRIWALENPPKFKKGDKLYYKNGNDVWVNELVVVSIQKDNKYILGSKCKVWGYKLYNNLNNDINWIDEDNLILTTDVEQTNNTTSARD
jgi:hypothetical protein